MNSTDAGDVPPHRYTAALAGEIERRWRDRWAQRGTFHAPNPVGELSPPEGVPVPEDKLFVQDMFPYPSGSGLHVGHPLGFIGTDVFARYHRMTGRNVLHTMGFDAFGLPAPKPTSRATWHRSAGWDWAMTSAAGSLPPTSSTTAGPSGYSCRSTTRGTTPRRAELDRLPNYATSTPTASAPRQTVATGPR
jgi:hypothetical protein